MNASVAIQVLPNVQDEEEVIRIVDEVIAYIRSTGLNYFYLNYILHTLNRIVLLAV